MTRFVFGYENLRKANHPNEVAQLGPFHSVRAMRHHQSFCTFYVVPLLANLTNNLLITKAVINSSYQGFV